MSHRVVLCRIMLMTRRTQSIVIELQLVRMRIVAVGATNAIVVHLALQKRTVNVNFVEDLAVRIISRRRQQLGRIVIVETGSTGKAAGNRRPA